MASLELHRAVKLGDTAQVRELLRTGADVNATDRYGRTPLMHALENGAASVELAALLLDSGGVIADTSRVDGMAHNLASLCLRGCDPLKLNLAIERGADLHYVRGPGYNALLDAVFTRNDRDPRLLDILRILIASGVELNRVSGYGESALRVLSRIGRFDAVKLLLDAGADESQLAWTPLHRAVALGTLIEVERLVETGWDLEATDFWQRTPWLVAVKIGDLEKARYLIDCGADYTVTERGGASPLDLATESFHTPMLKCLIELGLGIESVADCCQPPLMVAVSAGNVEAVEILIAAGADVDRRTPCGTALGHVQRRDIALLLLNAGADPAQLSSQGRRGILGLEPESDDSLFDATPEDFRLAPGACWGDSNPELMDQPFWQAMICSGLSAYEGAKLVDGTYEDRPVWCAQRFGQSLTLLPDGRAIQIGGEHEDFYDSNFCIYNDVLLHHPDGRIDVYCYPEDVFPPTDFHTATLVGDTIYVIGSLGYQGSRRFAETPAYCLDINTLVMSRIEATGDCPGWISRHRAALSTPHEIRIWGGKICAEAGESETYTDNQHTFFFDIEARRWRCETA